MISSAIELFSGTGAIGALLAIAFLLLNLKSLPLAWHVRIFSGFFQHGFVTRTPKDKAGLLFQPLIISTRSPALECDYNLHKSNSTYFSDLDVARAHLIACLMRLGITEAGRKFKSQGHGSFGVILGGVACNFRREIKPYEAVDIYTRVLSWDRKWLYLVSYVVKKGTKPKAYTLQPWKKGSKTISKPIVCAASVAKYVFKQGRMTIPPALVLQEAGLLPEKPADIKIETSGAVPLVHVPDMVEPAEADTWSWEVAERERVRGKGVAELMNELDTLHEDFEPDNQPALGVY
ncbi:hypothetical protein MMC26_001513 [Xylographa opegraphella]|nr:hypothetical protein [Xylographa opegraphella]